MAMTDIWLLYLPDLVYNGMGHSMDRRDFVFLVSMH
jgi:hypothetical protein